jgi:uncharacterized membrane protein YbhN (UPF0104 family)
LDVKLSVGGLSSTRLVSISIIIGLLVYGGVVLALTDGTNWVIWMKTLPWWTWLEVAGLALLSYSMRFLRWVLFMRRLGHRLPMGRHLTIYLSAFALTFTPAKLGETIRSLYLFPMGVPYAHSLAAFLSERLLDVLVVAVLATLALSLFPQHGPWLGLVLLVLGLVVLLLRSRWLTWGAQRMLKGALQGHATQAMQAVRMCLSVGQWWWLLPLSVVAWSAQGVALSVVLGAMGQDLALPLAVAVYALGILAGAASFVPGGLLVTEGAMVVVLVALGFDWVSATFAALAVRGLTLWMAVGLGALSLLALVQRPPAKV